MVDIATTLAADFLEAQGWACICIKPATDECVVTVAGIRDRDEPGIRLWLQRPRADKTLAAFFSRCQQAQRRPRGEGLIVNADVAMVDGMIRGIADALGFALVGDGFIDQQMALVTTRIEAALPRVTKGLGKETARRSPANDAATVPGLGRRAVETGPAGRPLTGRLLAGAC